MRKLTLVMAFLVLTLAVAADDSEYPHLNLPERYAIAVKGREIIPIWRGGRPFVHRNDVAHRLGLPNSGEQWLDLFDELENKGYQAEFSGGLLSFQPPRGGSSKPLPKSAERSEEYPYLELPDHYSIKVKSREIVPIWRGGRPFVHRNDLAHRLGLPSYGEPTVDLFKALEEKQYVASFSSGVLTFAPPSKAAYTATPSGGQPRRASSDEPLGPRWVAADGSRDRHDQLYVDRRSISVDGVFLRFNYRDNSNQVSCCVVQVRNLEYKTSPRGDADWSEFRSVPPKSIWDYLVRTAHALGTQ